MRLLNMYARLSHVGLSIVAAVALASSGAPAAVARVAQRAHPVAQPAPLFASIHEPAQAIPLTYRLTQSTGDYQFWTTPPTEKVFRDTPAPSVSGSEVLVYAAKNEFEPFQVVVRPAASGNVAVSVGSFGPGISVELYEVKYVTIVTVTDYLGRAGANPDPLWPLQNNATVSVAANQNTAFWFSVFVSRTVAAGDYTTQVTIGGVNIPVRLHVFNFTLPDELHVDSYVDGSISAIHTKYAVPSDQRPAFRDKINQYMIDHRVSLRQPMWPGGLTSSGAVPYISYDCATNTFSDTLGVDGFVQSANKYLKGIGFNEGTGLPAWGAAWYKTSTASAEQRGALCGLSPAGWMSAYPFTPGTFNHKWFNEYIPALRNYLNSMGLLDKAYYCTQEEPQNTSDYNAIAWYTQELKRVAPDLKLMVAEEPRPEIYANPTYAGAKVDIWDAHFGTANFNPISSLQRLAGHNEETWIYFLHNTYLPRFNPITIDHPGYDARLLGWFLWKYRVRGFEYWRFNEWGANPWTTPRDYNQNGNWGLLYPPTMDNSPLPSYGANGNRFVPSIRFELIRDSLEDYEYFYLLSGGAQPQPYQTNPADALVDRVIQSQVAYTRDGEFMQQLRRLIGLKLGGEIASIPDVAPAPRHPRASGAPGNYYINFQNPAGEPVGAIIYNGHTYMKIGNDLYSAANGYGWQRASEVPQSSFYNAWDQWVDPEPKKLNGSAVLNDWGRNDVFEFDLPNGTYRVTAGVGWRGGAYRHYVTINGVPFFNGEATVRSWMTTTRVVAVTTRRLLLEMGKYNEISMINYLDIEAWTPAARAFLPVARKP